MGIETTETLGEYLKAGRENAGLTLEEVSRITKIRPPYIEAIEKDDFSMFSSPQLLKGYVKLIANTVKVDAKEAVSLLETEAEKDFKDRQIEDIVGNRLKEDRQKSKNFKKRILIIVFAGIFLIILSYAVIKIRSYLKTFKGIPTTLPFHSSVKPLVSKRHISKKENEAKKTDYRLILKGTVIEKTWVAVKIDGRRTVTSMLYPGNKVIWKAKNKIWIKIGNAGGIILNYDGKKLGKLGALRQVVTLNFPPAANNKF